jgi:putative ABC transport system permease protein
MLPGRLTSAVYAIALRAFPRDRRVEYADEMADAFAREFAARRTHGRWAALAFVAAASLDALRAGLDERTYQRQKRRGTRHGGRVSMGMSWLDVKLGLRMLARFPGLAIAGGLALAITIGIGGGWYDFAGDFWRPAMPFPGGDRLVEIEMRDSAASQEERRILHDLLIWRRDARTVEDLGAFRTQRRNLALGDARPEPVTIAEISASAFRLTNVPPLIGRPLLESDERPGAAPVVLLGYSVWQGRFAGRTDIVGQTVRLGNATATVVGVMPEGYAFPINHRLWTPLQLRPSGYAPLEGAGIRVFGRVAQGATQAQANAEIATLNERLAAASPATHRHLRPRVLAWGGESPGDRSVLELAITHLPIVLVLLVACANVGTLLYARTSTRDAEIAIRFALGAGRARIVSQLFVEALVLASIAAVVGLFAANLALKWGIAAYYSGQNDAMPFWIQPGLKLTTIIYAAALTIAGAALLSIVPALKVTGTHAQATLKNLGAGGSTLQFGWMWTSVMIFQVALTVICIPPAAGIAHEAIRDRQIREQFPAEEYVAARVALDRDPSASADEHSAASAAQLDRVYRELEWRVRQEPGVTAVTFADRLPGMGVAVQRAEVEVSAGAVPVRIENLWTASVGQQFFDTFRVPVVAGRDFHDGDRAAGSTAAIVNEAFARRFTAGASPVGKRVRFASPDPSTPPPWFEIVGMVRDVGMTPTDLGEAPYLFRAVTPATAAPLVMGVRTSADPATLLPRLRTIALELDLALRLDEVRSLDDLAWRQEMPAIVTAGMLATVVGLGLFLSAAGIFSLMSVNVSRRTREIGLRAALGASQSRLIAGIFTKALVLIGSGILAGNAVLLLIVTLSEEVGFDDVWGALVSTSAVMLTVGLLACIEPARRALRIHPTDALKEA